MWLSNFLKNLSKQIAYEFFYSYIPLTEVQCNGNPDQIKEARLSFPSGHSSFSTFSMIFLIVKFLDCFNVKILAKI